MKIAADPEHEIRMCQIILALNREAFSPSSNIADAVIASLGSLRYPGERSSGFVQKISPRGSQ